MQQWLKEVARGKRGSKDLSYEETLQIARTIAGGNATDAQTAAYFVAQRMKTESPEELLAFVHAFQEQTTNLSLSSDVSEPMIDFAGPYNGRNSFMATIPVSLLLAENGMPAFLHSSDTLPPKYGVTIKEVLASLGIEVDQSEDTLTTTIEKNKIGFAWTEKYCQSLADIRNIREEIGVRTLLNTVEKLLNVAGAGRIMMGAFHRTAINKIYPIFKDLSYKQVYMVQGLEGSEDVPVHRNSFVFKLTEDKLDSFIVKPDDFGMMNKDFDKNQKLTADEQSKIILSILSGEKSQAYTYYYNQVVFNAGLRYYLFDATPTIEDGIAVAKEQLREARGMRQLEQWREKQIEIH
ncbi:anthranilate phosphoribosyltransferase [Aquibacillus sediminis]|uniref:anthranilate phosphoribosyltransferase n=1 Tax=Aquibacillus sediminis TaxID=2574734 RepID=UPI00110867BF|nr:anthranilate phosphoribosyltransferase [Aquibacillus sediminis]